jgi:branched-chain amino acid transport system permease protein
MVFAGIVGIPLMRLSGIAAALALFSVLVIVHNVADNWVSLTNGTANMFGVPLNTTMTNALPWTVGAILIAHLFTQGRIGLRLRASREDEVAARAIGVRVARDRWFALVLSAFIVGVGGFLYSQYLGAFNPDDFYLDITFLTTAMLVVGGMNSLAGAVVGTVVLSVVSQVLAQLEAGAHVGPVFVHFPVGTEEVGLAGAMILILIFRPSGITGGNELHLPRRCRPAAGKAAVPHDRLGGNEGEARDREIAR